jgi:hypothetical protein
MWGVGAMAGAPQGNSDSVCFSVCTLEDPYHRCDTVCLAVTLHGRYVVCMLTGCLMGSGSDGILTFPAQ